MRRHTLRRLGLTLLTVAVATMGLTAPAQAAPATGTITGQLTDHGVPVAGVAVDAYGESYGSAVTDEDGRYRIADLVPGNDYRVYFMPPGRLPQYAHRAVDWDSGTPITVTSGAETVVDDSLIPVGTITGRVTRPDGSPIAWCWVSVALPDANSITGTYTDQNGYYTLSSPTGPQRLRFTGPIAEQYAPGKREYSEAGLYEVVEGQTITVDETALAVGTVAGRVTRVDGSPVAWQTVVAEPVTGGNDIGVASTDGNGAYRIDVLPGDYVVGLEFGESMKYVPGGRSRADAQVFTVAADTVTTVDEVLRGTGRAQGRFTDSTGNGLDNVRVSFEDTVNGGWFTATTDFDGYWRRYDIPEGDYKVYFSSTDHGISQWAYGKVSAAEAETITVAASQTVYVDDTKLPGGSVRITAKNAVTGAVIEDFSVSSGRFHAVGWQGVALLPDVPAGAHELNVYAMGFVNTVGVQVTAVAGEQTEIEVALQPYARLKAQIVDAETGAPIEGVCLHPATTDRFRLFEGCQSASAADGYVTIFVEAGRYQVFALPEGDSPYGAQWVGQDGGTGDQREAKSWTFTAGQLRDIHKIRMDRAGVITGVVTGADGAPVTGGKVAAATPVVGNGSLGEVAIGGDGRYTVDFLGPYQWPLSFRTGSHAWQWSGAQAKRHDAVEVSVQAGQTTTFDQQLKLGTEVRVTVAGGPPGGFAVAYTVGTGDVAGYAWVEQSGAEAVFRVLGSQHVKFQYDTGSGNRHGWYGGTDFASATSVRVYANGTPTVVSYQFS
ncbi:carboxypeptidase regulatory-like domain-containing protein [Catellatospora vulcania]|uniref:carboxypeptidase regulatory-like domain-containing protein n=1 Tax=Catellatospora vulcania TaxID=1460450 RepID=UPI0012D47A7C|nr:carboxypeptidase regulatory-like domain-containing protein [Catellatospora vulcania]